MQLLYRPRADEEPRVLVLDGCEARYIKIYLHTYKNIYTYLQISTHINKYLHISTNIYTYLQVSSHIYTGAPWSGGPS